MSDLADLLKIRLRLEFDGRDFCGWQIQSPDKIGDQSETEHLPSVQGVLEKAIATYLHFEAGRRVTVQGCGRTDAGVHAREFFCHFELEAAELLKTPDPIERLRYSLNCLLPNGVAVTHAEKVPATFHALRDVTSKIYCYRILFRRAKATLDQGYCWWIPRIYDEQSLDLINFSVAFQSLVGNFDFKAFTASNTDVKTTVRRILRCEQKTIPLGDHVGAGTFLELRFCGEGFLKHQIRNMVGSLMDVAQRKMSLVDFQSLFMGDASKSRVHAGYCAPPHGLFLERVFYEPR